ncbi:carboxypeptidase M32 [Granulicella cerasi]|uniref:Metal-dependent carboxypeptidase n=1 Tax=Granulicella cerasi TaxID=741063 RepID=A0ABW1ZAG8_9BACT|nr:carboxypeptidase M32 [Granulicella cerasi]
MSYAQFLEQMGTVNDLLCSASMLSWDARTMMPAGAVEVRGQQIATLMTLARTTLLSDETLRRLEAAERSTRDLAEDSAERRAISQTQYAIALHKRIPDELQEERVALREVSRAAWVKARAEDRFEDFAPYLEKVVALARRVAESIGYEQHPYDALLSLFEPGETVVSLDKLFGRLRESLIPLLRAVQAKPQVRWDFLERDFPEDAQRDFGLKMAEAFGYDLRHGRLDNTVHPFEISFTREDVRITTRYKRNYLPASLFGTLHETGHALYEQGVDPAYTRTPLATDMPGMYAVGGVSFGAHESQSRLYENHIARSKAFWDLHYPSLVAAFPSQLADVDAAAFHRAVNRVQPGLIRVEADEMTYDFHIMLRTEIERDLIAGTLEVKDLPERWNAAMKSDLGLDVPNNRLGVLQDTHWSTGQIGTFCNYTIGNVMAAQLFKTAVETDASIQPGLDEGNYAPLRHYLRETVHQHGRRFSRDELLLKATGRTLDPEPYIEYLTKKYTELYELG